MCFCCLMLVSASGQAAEPALCSPEQAAQLASSTVSALLAQSDGEEAGGVAAGAEMRLLGTRQNVLAGPVYRFRCLQGHREIEIASHGCQVVRFVNGAERPKTWPRTMSDNGAIKIVPLQQLKNRYVKCSRDGALTSAKALAHQLAGGELFATLELRQEQLVDQGNYFAYVFRWAREEIRDSLRVGVWVIRVSVNPETCKVYDVQFVQTHPSQSGIVTGEEAIRAATISLAPEWGYTGCSLQSGALTEDWSGETDKVRRLWSLVFTCEAEGKSPETKIVRIDAVTGLICSQVNESEQHQGK